ncbi:MAG: hypothetical protein ABF759_12130, partial [Acetobacter malorum]|uniref:hypothetical protein n=1 Tax=Acetobacter malorum TaxID=178901 RepID=UPI0039E7C661
MSEKPTGVFVRLPVTDEQAQEMYRAYCAAYASSSLTTRGIATQAALFEVGTPVHSGNLDPSRECFEKFYAQMCARATGHDTTPEYVSGLRTGNNYGGRTFLNNAWQAWPDYVKYVQAQIAALEAEVVRLREDLDASKRKNFNAGYLIA